MTGILDALKERIIVCDGATGTMLYNRGIPPDHCYEHLNLTQPRAVENLHLMYLDAGAGIIETNTFGANASQLEKFRLQHLVVPINEAAARIARQCAAGKAYVAGSIGPLNRFALGTNLSDDDVYAIYREQAVALANGGIDLFILETFCNLEQIRIALAACKKETGLPVIAQMAFPDGQRTGFGNSIHAVVSALEEDAADVIGTNCGNGPVAAGEAAARLLELTDKPISVQPNAGYPQIVDGRSLYLTSPEYFASHALALAEAGVSIIGGCCGTTPDHIRLVSQAVKCRAPVARVRPAARAAAVAALSPAFFEKASEKKTQVIVELLPPKNADTEKLIDTAAMLKNSGAQVLSFPENPLGQVRMSAIAAAGLVKKTTRLETIFHYTCRDRNLIGLQSELLGAHALGLRAVLAVTGDPAAMGGNPEASSVFDLDSIKLVKLIDNMKKNLQLDMRVGVAFNPNFADISGQVERLKRKIAAGAEFIMTQPVFDREKIAAMSAAVKPLGVPLFLGILPLVSKKNAEYLHNEVPGMSVPAAIRARMDIQDKDAARQEGIAIALEIIRGAAAAVDGFYLISPLHKYEISAQILKQI